MILNKAIFISTKIPLNDQFTLGPFNKLTNHVTVYEQLIPNKFVQTAGEFIFEVSYI